MKQAGLTIVEVTVAIGLALIVTVGLLPLFFHMFAGGAQTTAEASMQEQSDQALSIITSQVARSKEIVVETYPVDTQEPAGAGWVGSDSVLILQQIATTLAPQNPNRKPVSYNPLPGWFTCDTFNLPIYAYYVYYTHEGVLYQRTVGSTIPTSNLCDGATTMHQQTSCLTCSDKPKDIILARNVESFSINYTPEDPGETNPYANTDIVRMSLTLKTDNYKYTSTTSARLLLAGSN